MLSFEGGSMMMWNTFLANGTVQRVTIQKCYPH